MSPITGGGGGGTTYAPYASDYFTYRANGNVGDSDFLATIQGFTMIAGEVVYNVGWTGDADYLNYFDGTDQLAQLVLHNTTRSNSGLVRSHVAGTRTITLEDEVPADWAIGDTITLRSQVCDIGGSPYYFDLDVARYIPENAISIDVAGSIRATAANNNFNVHPYQTYAAGAAFGTNTFVANVTTPLYLPCKCVSQRFCFRINASGANTVTTLWFKLQGWELE